MEEKYHKMKINDPIDIAKLLPDYPTEDIIGVVGYYETIIDILNWLIKNTVAEFVEGELHSSDYDNYEDAYVLQYFDNGIYIDRLVGEKYSPILTYDKTYLEEDFIEEYTENNIINDSVTLFGYKDEEHQDDECNYFCMDDDLCGFCCCIDNTKFKYRGSVKLTTDMINKILNDFLD